MNTLIIFIILSSIEFLILYLKWKQMVKYTMSINSGINVLTKIVHLDKPDFIVRKLIIFINYRKFLIIPVLIFSIINLVVAFILSNILPILT